MKSFTLKPYFILFNFFLFGYLFGQTPEKMTYQAVVRNSSNGLVSNHAVGTQISILQSSATGTAVYVETHSTTTNANGLMTLEIGNGTVISGHFSSINWANGPYFLKTETDPSGGNIYTITGVSQLLSVPFALHAKTAESLSSGITETDPLFNTSPAHGISGLNITNWNTAFGWGNHANAGYLTSFTETDPLFSTSPSFAISGTNITNWNNAFNWGNHATAGYLTSFTETDPLFSASPSFGILGTNITNWNNAFGWGNHALVGYLTSFTETDPKVGNNTTNYLSKWDGTKLVTSSIFDNGKIGIGIENTTFPLEVKVPLTTGLQMNFKITNPLDNAQNIGGSGVGMYFAPDASGISKMGIFMERKGSWGVGTLHFLSRTSQDYASADLSNSVMALTQNGNLGIGTVNPEQKLDVQGYINAASGLCIGGNCKSSWLSISPWQNNGLDYYYNSGNIGIGTSTPTTPLDVNGIITAVGGNSTNWNTAYGWGDHATAGYLTDFTETDPEIGTNTTNYIPKWDGNAMVAGSIYQDATTGNIGIGTTSPGIAKLSVWNGNISVSNGGVLANTGFWGDALRTNWGNDLLLKSSYSDKGILFHTQSGEKMRIDALGNVGIGTSSPTTPLDVNGIITAVGGNSTNWNTAYGWGDHATAGYLTSYTETDPLFSVSPSATISGININNWNEVYSWGNHATAGYLTSYTETDPIFDVSPAKNISATDISNWDNKLDAEVDGSITNEIQTLSISNNTITLSNGGGSVLLPNYISSLNITNDSLYVNYSHGEMLNVGYVGNGSPGASLATIATVSISNLNYYDTVVLASITSIGNEFILNRGICLSTQTAPDLNDIVFHNGNGPGDFTTTCDNLLPNTLYHVRAFATNSVGTSYGNELTFTTKPLSAPILETSIASNITNTTAISGGNITDDGGLSITDRGICWSTDTAPDLSDQVIHEGEGNGNYLVLISGLTGNVTYYIRAFANNSLGTSYGNEISFTTITYELATVVTDNATDISYTNVTAGGNVTNDNGSTVTERGVCWATTTNPTTTDAHLSQNAGLGTFTFNITGLTANTPYFLRAYAINGGGTSYGNEVTFTTIPTALPMVSTKAISGISSNIASSGGNISSDGGLTISAKGVCWSINPNPTLANTHTTDGTGNTNFNSTMTGLNPLTTYYVLAYATNALGTTYGNELSFTTTDLITPIAVPTLATTTTVMNSSSTASSGGYISLDGGSPITERGVCWSTSENPTIADNHSSDGTGVGYFSSTVSGISGCGNVYYVKAYATNATGTGYGNQVTVTSGLVATVNTLEVTNIDNYTATCGGSILDTGGCEITQKGVCWSYSPNPTTAHFITTEGPGNSDFTSTLTNLYGNRTYYVKAYVTNSKGTAYGPEKVFTTLTPPTPYIGQDYAGGKVFYIDGTGQHGMVAVDPSAYLPWGCYGTLIGGTQTGIGTGATNTAIIVAGCTEENTAAKYCDNLSLNSYSDWFLPSNDELNEINIKLFQTGSMNRPTNVWSSTESSSYRGWALGGNLNTYDKDYNFSIIATRSF